MAGLAHEELAWAVLERAVRDARSRNLPVNVREDAVAFLRGGPELAFWTDVAGISARHVWARARQRF